MFGVGKFERRDVMNGAPQLNQEELKWGDV
jgi:hypothetical protein